MSSVFDEIEEVLCQDVVPTLSEATSPRNAHARLVAHFEYHRTVTEASSDVNETERASRLESIASLLRLCDDVLGVLGTIAETTINDEFVFQLSDGTSKLDVPIKRSDDYVAISQLRILGAFYPGSVGPDHENLVVLRSDSFIPNDIHAGDEN